MTGTPLNVVLDVVGIGNAIVDVISHCEEADLARLQLNRGAMTLIDAERADWLYAHMGPALECSGGSACNTIAGIAALGGKAGYIGKVKADQLGSVFSHDITAAGAAFSCSPAMDGPPTARCLIFVTPDGERTMNTYLGACVDLGPEDVDTSLIARAEVTYMEGYLWDKEAAKNAFLKAARAAHSAGKQVALSLSDPFCVDRHRDSFLDLIAGHIDILFANEEEIKALYRTATFEAALDEVRGHCKIAAITRGPRGSVVLQGDATHDIAVPPVAHVVDTTGAGDLFAAGFLYGYTRGKPVELCARIGSACAAEIISHIGARPEADLAGLIPTA